MNILQNILRYVVILSALAVIAFPEVRTPMVRWVFLGLAIVLGTLMFMKDVRLHREGRLTWSAVLAGELKSSPLDWFWPALSVWAVYLLSR